MGKYLYQIDATLGRVVCKYANDEDQELALKDDYFRELQDFTLEEKINVAFVAAAALGESIEDLVKTLEVNDLDMASLARCVNDIDERLSDVESEID